MQGLVKKLEQHADDHSQYKDAHARAAAWLVDIRQRLATFTDTSSTADRDEVQGQLQRLHEVTVLKEQGQTLLYAASTWGEKTLVTTSGEGRSVIQRELQVPSPSRTTLSTIALHKTMSGVAVL